METNSARSLSVENIGDTGDSVREPGLGAGIFPGPVTLSHRTRQPALDCHSPPCHRSGHRSGHLQIFADEPTLFKSKRLRMFPNILITLANLQD